VWYTVSVLVIVDAREAAPARVWLRERERLRLSPPGKAGEKEIWELDFV
jgi:hypothetical protein